MHKEKIEIIIDTDGTTTVDGHGFVGAICDKVLGFFERALGGLIKKKDKTERWRKDRANVTLH